LCDQTVIASEKDSLKTECNPGQLEFHALAFGRRDVVGRFDGGRITSDGGGVLLREVDARIGLTPRLAACFVDYRNPESLEHPVQGLLVQRIYALALGYEDLNDHDVLRSDSVLALLVGKCDLTAHPAMADTIGALRRKQVSYLSDCPPCFKQLWSFALILWKIGRCGGGCGRAGRVLHRRRVGLCTSLSRIAQRSLALRPAHSPSHWP
jgi:hypothetical protein